MIKLKEIPIQTVTRQSKYPRGYWLAKSMVCYKNWLGRSMVAHGFSLKKKQEHAKFISQCEVYERLFAYYDFLPQNKFTLLKWSDSSIINTLIPNEVILGPSPGYKVSRYNASGLSWHSSIHHAREHSVFEIIERHLLAKIWYQKQKLVPIFRKEWLNAITSIEYYTLKNNTLTPFVLAVANHKDNLFWLCGSAVSNSFCHSKEKSREEVLMLLDGILCNDNIKLNPNKKTAKRLLSLRNPKISINRKTYFNHLVQKNENELHVETNLTAVIKTDDIILNCFGHNAEIGYVILKNDNDGCLVRTFCKDAILLGDMRRANQHSFIPEDPFC